jgi:predicted nucleic acid-binding protein
MAMTDDSAAILIDTNLLVHANLSSSPHYLIAQNKIASYAQTGADLWISRQILREYLAVVTRPQTYSNPVPMLAAVADVTRFQTEYLVADDNEQVMQRLSALLSQVAIGGKQIHDANIVATMLAYGIRRILTENVSDFNRFTNLVDVLSMT